MQPVVADEPHAIAAEPRLAQRRLCCFDQGVPIELDQALAFAAADQHVEAMHRDVEIERLDPFDGDAQRVVASQVIEFDAVFALDRLDSKRLASPVGLRAPLPRGRGSPDA